MKLVDNARSAWRWFSVQAMTAAGALQGGWLAMPEDLKANIPAGMVSALTIGLLVLGVIGRLTAQGKGTE